MYTGELWYAILEHACNTCAVSIQLVQCHSSFAHHVDIVSPPLLARKYIFIRCPDIQTPDNVINDENQALHQESEELGNGVDFCDISDTLSLGNKQICESRLGYNIVASYS